MTTLTETLASANDVLAAHSSLLDGVRRKQRDHRRVLEQLSPTLPSRLLPAISPPSPPPSPVLSTASTSTARPQRRDLPPNKLARVARYANYVPEEETIRNDYSQHYVDSGDWPQNFVLGAEPEHRFEEYPKQHRLLQLKKQAVQEHSLSPMYLPFSDLSTLQPSKFDVILIDPPFSSSFTWEHLQDLPVPSLAADPSFVFMWVGSGAGQGLERGREVLAKWGYRRCEDVVWVRTNRTSNHGPGTDPPTTSLFTRTKQHCLIGIRGTVRRSSDSWFVHCNVDTDVIMWEGDPDDPTRKPPEMYSLIENFCMGTRRLEIFGKLGSSLRRGWVTAVAGDNVPQTQFSVEGPDGGTASPFEREQWDAGLKALSGGGKYVVPTTQEIDNLRPKSPVRNHSANNNNGGGGASGGVALGNVGPRFGNGGGMGMMGGAMGGGMDMNMMPGMAMAPMGMDPSMMNGGWGGPMMMNPQMMNPQMMDPHHAMMMGGGQGFGMMPMNGMHQMGAGQQGMMNRMGMGMGNPMGGQMSWGAQDNRMMPGMNMGGQWTGF